MYQIEGTLDAGIAPVVELLRRKGFNTFASCQGGPGHAFERPTVRIEPDNLYQMLSEVGEIALVLSEADYCGYSIKQVNAFQDEATPWIGQPGLNYIEVEFWQYPLEHPQATTHLVSEISFPAPEGWTPGQLLQVDRFDPVNLTTEEHEDVEPSSTSYYSLSCKRNYASPQAWYEDWMRDQLDEMLKNLDRQFMGDADAKEG